jgi:hypothetical protein
MAPPSAAFLNRGLRAADSGMMPRSKSGTPAFRRPTRVRIFRGRVINVSDSNFAHFYWAFRDPVPHLLAPSVSGSSSSGFDIKYNFLEPIVIPNFFESFCILLTALKTA